MVCLKNSASVYWGRNERGGGPLRIAVLGRRSTVVVMGKQNTNDMDNKLKKKLKKKKKKKKKKHWEPYSFTSITDLLLLQ